MISEIPVQETPRKILEAARAIMTEKGLLEVSLAEISERAGTNIALVSYYFGNREGLMVALALADGQRAGTHLARLLAADMSPTDKLSAHVNGLIDTYFERPYLHRLLQKLLREGSPDASAKVGQALVEPVAHARREIIGDGIRSGEFRAVDASLISFAIDGACSHIFSSFEGRRAVLGSGTFDRDLLERYKITILQFVLAGLRAAPEF